MRNSFINSAGLLLIIIVFVVMYSYASPHQSCAASWLTAPHATATASARQIHQRPPAPRNTPEAVQGGGQEGLSIFGRPTASARLIDTVLCSARSPACGTGQKLYNDSAARGIDPVAPLGFFWHESDFGKAGMARITHALGNLHCIDGAACVNTSGMTCQTTEQSCYAAHDEEAYISAVEYAVQFWRTGKAMRP